MAGSGEAATLRAGALGLSRPWMPGMLWWQAPVAAILLALAVWSGMSPFLLPAAAWLAAATPELVRVDLAEHRLPDRLTLPGYPLALAGVAAGAVAGIDVLPSLVTGAAALGLFLLLSLGGGMGLGDVKLAGVLGLLLVGVPTAVAALLIAFVSGGGAALWVLARRGRGARLPFGPFLLVGFWIALPLW